MRFLHVGFKVHDIDAVTRAWSELFGFDFEAVKEYRTGQGVSRVSHAWSDDRVEMEMVQAVGHQPLDDLVLGDRQGVSHIAFSVDDLAEEKRKAVAKGLKVLNEGSAPRASWFFIHDDRLGGVLVQMVQLNRASG